MRTRCARLVLRGADSVLSAVLLLQQFLGSFCVEEASVESAIVRQKEIETERQEHCKSGRERQKDKVVDIKKTESYKEDRVLEREGEIER